MKHAYVFPGQGAQFSGMGKDLYENNPSAKALFDKANEILGFNITEIMFEGTADELKQTKVTQPAGFLHSVVLAPVLGIKPDAVAGHSLGEFSALVAAGALSFEDGLRLVSKRAMAMQKCCESVAGGMAAILGLDDESIEQVCEKSDGVVVAATYSSTMGNYVMIDHGDNLFTIYMHASKLYVSEDDVVKKGQKIAGVGTTGRSTGNHLHFSVRKNGSYVSPWEYIVKP